MNRPKMGELSVFYKNTKLDYLINLEVADHVQDKTIEDILKYYPPDIPIEFKELY